MLRGAFVGLVFGVAAATAVGQGLPEPQQLQQATEDIEYAELLNAVDFTPEQLDEILRIRAALEAETAVGPDLAIALTKMLAAVLTGMSREQAQQALGDQQQLVQQAQRGVQESLERSIDELRELLTEQQRDALVWLNSPAHALDRTVNAVAQARNVDDARWNQFRTQVSQALSQMSSQVTPEGGASVETIGGLLDQVRAMDDATFEARRATLVQEWLQTLMPNVVQMLQTPQFRQERLRQACERLIMYERGPALIEAKRDVTDTQ